MFNLVSRAPFQKDSRPAPHAGPVSYAAAGFSYQSRRAYLKASKIVSSWYW